MNLKHDAASESADLDFVITRVFDAPRALVFKAWTNPQHMAKWWGPRDFANPVCELDVRPGGAYRIVMRSPDGVDYSVTGHYHEVVEPQRLVKTLDCTEHPAEWHDMVKPNRTKEDRNPAGVMLSTVTFDDLAGKTKLTVRIRFNSAAVRDAMLTMGMTEGWSMSLDRLTELLATQAEPLVIERTLDAPVATVWKAITDKDVMKQWGFEIPEFKPEIGCEFRFDAEDKGIKYIHRCVVTEVVAEKRLAYSWRYEGHEGNSLVTFELFSQGPQTRLRLTHAGLETFPKLPGFARENFAAGWAMIIGTGLKDFVEKTSATTSTADREIVTTRVFDAPRELVFAAWIDPKHVAQWWGPDGFTNTIHEMDVRQGGTWRFIMHGPDGVDYKNEFLFLEVVKPERLVYSHLSGPKFHLTVTFEDLGGQTKLTMQMVFETAALRDKTVKEFGAVEGAKQTLSRLAEFLAESH